MRVLLTGATGVVGHEVLTRLRRTEGVTVTAVSARGSAALGVLRWPMGRAPAPVEVRGPWDVVINSAADTRWNLSTQEAWQANAGSTDALLEILDPTTRLVHLSTLYAGGLDGTGRSPDPSAYRNTYEWSKAWSERAVTAAMCSATVVRTPLIIGRRVDGEISRFVGFYTLMKATVLGMAPLFVADPDAFLELVAVDDVARHVLMLALGPPPDRPRVVEMGRGAAAHSVRAAMAIATDTINDWRARHGVEAIASPPLLTRTQWTRFLRPLAEAHLSPRQQQVLEHLDHFVPYLSITEPFRPSIVVDDMSETLRTAVLHWLDRNPGVATRTPRRWALKGA